LKNKGLNVGWESENQAFVKKVTSPTSQSKIPGKKKSNASNKKLPKLPPLIQGRKEKVSKM